MDSLGAVDREAGGGGEKQNDEGEADAEDTDEVLVTKPDIAHCFPSVGFFWWGGDSGGLV